MAVEETEGTKRGLEEEGSLTEERPKTEGTKRGLEEEGSLTEERPKRTLICKLEVNQKEPEEDLADYYDEKTGMEFDAAKVREARGEEIQFMKSIPSYEEASEEECWEVTGKRPISTKWVDINKGTEEEQ